MVVAATVSHRNRPVFHVFLDDEDDEARAGVGLYFFRLCDVGHHDDSYDGTGCGSHPHYFSST